MKYVFVILLFLSPFIVKAQDSDFNAKNHIAFLIKTTPKYDEDGSWVYGGGDGKTTVTYVSTKSIIKVADSGMVYYKVWVKDYREKYVYMDKSYDFVYSLERIFIDCKKNMYRPITVNYYDCNDKLINTLEWGDTSRWTEPVINSVGEAFFNVACQIITTQNKKK